MLKLDASGDFRRARMVLPPVGMIEMEVLVFVRKGKRGREASYLVYLLLLILRGFE